MAALRRLRISSSLGITGLLCCSPALPAKRRARRVVAGSRSKKPSKKTTMSKSKRKDEMNDSHEKLTFHLLDDEKPMNPKDLVGVRKAPMSTVPATVLAGIGVAMLKGAIKYDRVTRHLMA